MKNKPHLITFGSTFALLAVALGAFGAHALQARLEELGAVDVWQTAVDYQMWHALALLALAAYPRESRGMRVTAYCFCLGILLFSGSLYWLALDGPRWLGPVTPIGGMLLIVGWAALLVGSLVARNKPDESN